MRENAQTFADVDVRSLMLYRINVDVPQHNSYHKILEEISKGRYKFTMKEGLFAMDIISDYSQEKRLKVS